jgi:hypothetical protein
MILCLAWRYLYKAETCSWFEIDEVVFGLWLCIHFPLYKDTMADKTQLYFS